jgi:hypothetical protein
VRQIRLDLPVVQQRSVQVDKCLSDANDVALTRAEVAMIIDALLQARATLCIMDDRFVSVHIIEWMRAQQLLLADRLEDAMVRPGSHFMASAEFILHVPLR